MGPPATFIWYCILGLLLSRMDQKRDKRKSFLSQRGGQNILAWNIRKNGSRQLFSVFNEWINKLKYTILRGLLFQIPKHISSRLQTQELNDRLAHQFTSHDMHLRIVTVDPKNVFKERWLTFSQGRLLIPLSELVLQFSSGSCVH
jgi:hypothetical protein